MNGRRDIQDKCNQCDNTVMGGVFWGRKRFCISSFVSRGDKMRRFAEIWRIELLASVERLGNAVYCSEKSFHLS